MNFALGEDLLSERTVVEADDDLASGSKTANFINLLLIDIEPGLEVVGHTISQGHVSGVGD